MSEGLRRQRRNLILTSVLLWLMKFGGVSFSKFSIVGFDVEFANPDALTLCIWIAFAYFLYRYYLYFAPEGLPKLVGAFATSINRHARKSLEGYVLKHVPEWSKGIQHPLLAVRSRGWLFQAEKFVIDSDGARRRTEPFELRVPRRRFILPTFVAVADTLLRDHVTTDFVLPFVLALFVLLYCGFGEWPGSLSKILF